MRPTLKAQYGLCGLGRRALGARGWQCSGSEGDPKMAQSGVQKRKPEVVPRERTLYASLLNFMEEASCGLNKRPFTSMCITSLLPGYTCI